MSSEAELREKLRKIEALFAGAGTPGEKAAAGAAAERIRDRLRQDEKKEPAVEYKFSLPDPWSQQLFCALCRRYGLKPFRYSRQRRQTVMVKGPASFLERVLWSEFQQLDVALSTYLSEVTEKLIREEVYRDTQEADIIADPPQLK